MSNRARGSNLWSEILQVSVSPEMKNEIGEIAKESGKSQSSVVRSFLNEALGKEPSEGE